MVHFQIIYKTIKFQPRIILIINFTKNTICRQQSIVAIVGIKAAAFQYVDIIADKCQKPGIR